MKLDKRVKENALIGHCFNAEELKKYISRECYFTDDLEDFSDLTNTLKGVLKAVAPDAEECYLVKYELNGQPAGLHYTFCLPAEFVEEEEKKYRPYTLEEFLNEGFEILNEGFEIIVFREKNNPSMEYHVRYNGYRKCDNVYKVILGNISYTFDDLFEDFERFYNGRWYPFGVKEE